MGSSVCDPACPMGNRWRAWDPDSTCPSPDEYLCSVIVHKTVLLDSIFRGKKRRECHIHYESTQITQDSVPRKGLGQMDDEIEPLSILEIDSNRLHLDCCITYHLGVDS